MRLSRRTLLFSVLLIALAATALTGYRAYLVHELRKPVLAELTDPGSAQFRDERYVGGWTVSRGILCGQVNARNRMGGYNGFTYFDSYSDKAFIRPVDMPSQEPKENCGLGESDYPWWWLRW